GDQLFGDADNDVIVGDDARITRDASGKVIRIDTTDPDVGGDDVIDGNTGADTVLGGTGDDKITGGTDVANDILLGDNGSLVFNVPNAPAHVYTIFSTAPVFGGVDTIDGGPRTVHDVLPILGDQLFGDAGADLIVGDDARITRDASNNVLRTATIDPQVGGDD